MTSRIMNPPPTCTVDDCDRPYLARGFCSTHYGRARRGARLDVPIADKRRDSPEVRFDRKWVLDPDTGCHIWQDHLVRGYGQFRIKAGQQVTAHIYAYERVHGPVPDGLVLDHTCHPDDGTCAGGECIHRRCCNPDHVQPITRGQNTLRSATGRSAVNARRTHCQYGHELPPYVPGGRRVCRQCFREKRYVSLNRAG